MERESLTGDTGRSPTVTPQRPRLAAQAARDAARVCTTRASLLAEDVLWEASRPPSQASAPGMDGGPAEAYAAHLDKPRRALPARLRSGRAQAAPGERVWRAQEDGRHRPIGQPACEDQIVQRAGVRRLDASDAQDCLDCSSGWRPGRSPHAARHERRARGRQEGRGWIGDAEGRGDGESMDRPCRREVLRTRVHEGRRVRRMGKWRRAGGMAHGARTPPETGVVQGGGRAPVRANLVLHAVLEAGVEREVQPRLTGRRVLTRCADAGGIGCAWEADAQKSMAV